MEISIEHLNKNYGKQNVLKDISLHIPIGMYGMLGENGAGKTTLMRILATLSEPTTGMVEINGIDIKRKKEIRKIIGYLPQEFSIYPNMTVYSALDYLGILTDPVFRRRCCGATPADHCSSSLASFGAQLSRQGRKLRAQNGQQKAGGHLKTAGLPSL